MLKLSKAILGLLWAVLALSPTGALSKDTEFGKTKLASYEVSTELLAAIALQQKSPPSPDGRTVRWSTPVLKAPPAGNPYKVVIRAYGTSVGPGPVKSTWWPALGVNEDGARGGMAIPVKAEAATAGARITWEVASPPLSMQIERDIQGALEFVSAENIVFDRVVVEVWSGVGSGGFFETLFAWGPLLTGLLFLGLFFWFRRN